VEDLGVAQERNRLARDLHDSVTQTVFSMNLTAQAARLLLEKDPGRVEEQLARLQELDQSAMGEIQVLLAELKPRAVLEGGLAAALARLAAERQQRDGLRVRLETAAPRDLPERVALGLYRIAQEALNNAVKHSGAVEVILRLNLEARPAYLEVEDCGSGFELDAASAAAQQKGHIGLAGMVERAREIGWQLEIASRPGSGTRVRVEGSLE
jgi:signal transduction histidine kinase